MPNPGRSALVAQVLNGGETLAVIGRGSRCDAEAQSLTITSLRGLDCQISADRFHASITRPENVLQYHYAKGMCHVRKGTRL